MLNISDKTAEFALKEDDHYLCHDSIEQYSADTDEFEYYHLSGKDYEKDKIAEAFVSEKGMYYIKYVSTLGEGIAVLYLDLPHNFIIVSE